MKKSDNIFKKDEIIKKGEKIKESLSESINKAKGFVTRGVSIGAILAIMMSSSAFGAEYDVETWEEYKEALMQDIKNLDNNTKITFKNQFDNSSMFSSFKSKSSPH